MTEPVGPLCASCVFEATRKGSTVEVKTSPVFPVGLSGHTVRGIEFVLLPDMVNDLTPMKLDANEYASFFALLHNFPCCIIINGLGVEPFRCTMWRGSSFCSSHLIVALGKEAIGSFDGI